MVSEGDGGAKGIRTPDLLNAIQTLSQLSYSPTGAGSIAAGPGPATVATVTAPTLEPRTVRLPGGDLAYGLRRSARSRGLRVTVDPGRGVLVTVPPAARRGWAHPEPRIAAFLAAREGWVRRHLERAERARASTAEGRVRYLGAWHAIGEAEAGPGEPTRVERVGGETGDELVVRRRRGERRASERVLEAWLRARAAEAIDRAVAAHADALGVHPSRVAILDPRTRWGSATRAGRVMLSWRLIMAPPAALEGVVVHELCHLRVFGHGPRFWALVASRLPDHAEPRRWLRRHALELHAAEMRPSAPPADG
jgi:predicted metal-dependent hydrolase